MDRRRVSLSCTQKVSRCYSFNRLFGTTIATSFTFFRPENVLPDLPWTLTSGPLPNAYPWILGGLSVRFGSAWKRLAGLDSLYSSSKPFGSPLATSKAFFPGLLPPASMPVYICSGFHRKCLPEPHGKTDKAGTLERPRIRFSRDPARRPLRTTRRQINWLSERLSAPHDISACFSTRMGSLLPYAQ